MKSSTVSAPRRALVENSTENNSKWRKVADVFLNKDPLNRCTTILAVRSSTTNLWCTTKRENTDGNDKVKTVTVATLSEI